MSTRTSLVVVEGEADNAEGEWVDTSQRCVGLLGVCVELADSIGGVQSARWGIMGWWLRLH